MRIGELAQRCAVSTDAIRLYEARGLLRAVRQSNGYRDYPAQAVEIVQVIRTAQALGFTLAEIAAHTSPNASLLQAEPDLPALFKEKAAMVQARIEALEQLRQELLKRSGMDCPLRG